MLVTTYILVGLAQYVFVALKALQQRSVIHNTRWAVVPTSLSMAFFEVFVYASVASTFLAHGWASTALVALAMGIGGGLGCLTAMGLHDRILARGNK